MRVDKVTSFDVARLAGVSQPTVSRALRNLPGTSPETRERVLAAARQLSYVASDRGRALSTSSTRRIAVVTAALTNPYYPELVEPLRRELDARGFRTVVIADGEAEAAGVDALADGSYDGVVLTTTTRRSSLPRDLTERRVPHVLVNRLLDQPESPSCGVDNVGGARVVADLLVGLGHTRIGLIAGPVHTSTGRDRADGLRAGLRAHGLSVRRALTRRCPFTHDDGRRATAELIRVADPPTAIVCGNDVIALGALSAAHEAGLRVPDDLTVVGYDDIAMAGWPIIGLTTMRCDLDALARNGIDLLREKIATPESVPTVRVLAPTLVLRATHGPPSTSR